MGTKTIITCDIEGCEADAVHKQKTVSVRFTTDQTEGRSVTPYLSGERMDFCEEHYQRYIDNLPLVGHGCMGYNTIVFSKGTNE